MTIIRCVLPVIMVALLASCAPSEPSPIKDYASARKVFWRSVYPGQAQSLYCGETFSSARRNGYNIEHVFPMSWVTNALRCGTRNQCRQSSARFNSIEADLHNLYPSREDVNKARAAHRFDEVSGERRDFGQACDFEVDLRRRRAEVTPVKGGEVARSLFYMAHRYPELTIFASHGALLQRWHRRDPPDAEERARNDRIESVQGNRNPFIDQPELLDQLIEQGHFY